MQGTSSINCLSWAAFFFSLWQCWYALDRAATSTSALLLRADREAAQGTAIGKFRVETLMGFDGAKARHAAVLIAVGTAWRGTI